MKKRFNRVLAVVLAAAVAAAAMLCMTGCFTSMIGIENVTPDFSVPVEKFDENDKAAAAAIAAYFDAFAAKDAEGMADVLCSECLMEYGATNGATREDMVNFMQSNLDGIAAEYGENFVLKYDTATFRSEDVTDSVDSLNKSLGLDPKSEDAIDMARVITAEVWFEDEEGKELGRQTGSMLAYRYKGEWFINGSNG